MPAKDWRYVQPMNGWGTAALVLAVVALVVGLVPILGDLVALAISVVAVGCGVRGLLRIEDGLATNTATALAGLLLGSIAGLLSFLTLLAVFAD
jgi:uncharacterized membrane protein